MTWFIQDKHTDLVVRSDYFVFTELHPPNVSQHRGTRVSTDGGEDSYGVDAQFS